MPHSLVKQVANSDISRSHPKIMPEPGSIRLHSAFTITQHPPAIGNYRDTLDKLYNDSLRQQKPVPQWLREWEDKWNSLGNNTGSDNNTINKPRCESMI